MLVLVLLPGALALGMTASPGAQTLPVNIEDVLTRVGERVAEFYTRVRNVICIETSTVQPVDFSSSPQGFARTVESELRVEAASGAAPGEATVVRKVRKVNGRVPRDADKKDRAGCTDPTPLSPEPLAFLLPVHRSEYRFTIGKMMTEKNRPALMIDFATIDRRSQPELIEDPGGHDDCFDWSGHIAARGRIWLDAGSYDVLRVERGLPGPVDVDVPVLIERRYHLPSWVVLVRDEMTIRYKAVTFSDPDDVLVLPESIDSVTIVRGGLESTRRKQTYSDYKRFVADGRVLP